MKSKEELNALKMEIENLSKKLNELSEEELDQVTGGNVNPQNGQSMMMVAEGAMQSTVQIIKTLKEKKLKPLNE